MARFHCDLDANCDRMRVDGGHGTERVDLLNAIVKVEGLGLTLKRNQAYVMKYVMQDYNKL